MAEYDSNKGRWFVVDEYDPSTGRPVIVTWFDTKQQAEDYETGEGGGCCP